MAQKRTAAAWLALVLLLADIVAEVARIGICVTAPGGPDPVLCSDPIGPVSRLMVKLGVWLREDYGGQAPPVAPPPAAPPPVAPVSPLDAIRSGGKL